MHRERPVRGDGFTTWSGHPSPLRHFRDSALWQRSGTQSGACLARPDGGAVLLLGANYVGKTAAALELVTHRGFALISDSVIVLDVDQAVAVPYAVPRGLRRRTLLEQLPRLGAVATRETVNPSTGLVVLVGPEHLLGRSPALSAPVRDVVLLARGEGAPMCRLPLPDLKWYSGRSASEIGRLLPSTMTVVRLPTHAGPSQTADLIQRCLS